jgi:hypothetical protein
MISPQIHCVSLVHLARRLGGFVTNRYAPHQGLRLYGRNI